MEIKELKDRYLNKYEYRIFYSNEDEGYIATVSEFPGCSAFGITSEEALKEIKIALEGILEYMVENKQVIPEPLANKLYSGKFIVRTSPSLHARLVREALAQKLSLNSFISHILSKYLYKVS